MRKTLLFLSLLVASACSQATNAVNSDASVSNVQLETAKYFATSAGNVRVGNFKQSVLGTEYNARVSGRLYDCHYVRGTVSCISA
jgi:hypothetical protein